MARLAQVGDHELIDLGGDSSDRRTTIRTSRNASAGAIQAGPGRPRDLICGSGVGASVAAPTRCAASGPPSATTPYSAHQGVRHDDANVLTLGARVIGPEPTAECALAFLAASFSR